MVSVDESQKRFQAAGYSSRDCKDKEAGQQVEGTPTIAKPTDCCCAATKTSLGHTCSHTLPPTAACRDPFMASLLVLMRSSVHIFRHSQCHLKTEAMSILFQTTACNKACDLYFPRLHGLHCSTTT
mmetsp:Transcript_130605/g.254514  ORF Transcript_130605/g.254514 Transcript_130605/m.254514 type:complete len:126 (+) Transcript_130605:217-594(+)